jgi:proline iminopeptidase
LFDQRGCGRSKATQALAFNTTPDLIHDIERLRQHLGIDQWLVVGGSWGGGLGLAYLRAHPQACLGAVLRSVFLSRASDLQWFFSDAAALMPDAWHALARHVPSEHQTQVPHYLFDALLNGSDQAALPLARAWQQWENALTQRCWTPSGNTPLAANEASSLLHKYRLQSHYLKQLCFFPADGLLSHLDPLQGLPIDLLHGRLDWICLPQAAWAVHQALPHSRLQWIDNAGHNPFEAPFSRAMVQTIEDAVSRIY